MAFPVVPLAIAAGSLIASQAMGRVQPRYEAADVSTPVISAARETGRAGEIATRQRTQQVFGDISAAGLTGSAAGSAIGTVFSQNNVFRSRINAAIMDAISRAEIAQNIENVRVANQIEDIRIKQEENLRRSIGSAGISLAQMAAMTGGSPASLTPAQAYSPILEGEASAALEILENQSDSFIDSYNVSDDALGYHYSR